MVAPADASKIDNVSKDAKKLFIQIVSTFAMEPQDEAVLAKGLEAWDRAEQAREIIQKSGILITSRLGEVKPNPAIAIERDSRAAFLSAIRQLNLDYEPVTATARTASARMARWPR